MERLFGAAAVVLVVILVGLIASPERAFADPATQIDVCCAWNEELADGELTYEIGGASGDTLTAIEGAMEDWEEATGITLTPAGGEANPDITIRFKKGGGMVQGQALRRLDRSGFIHSVNINVSGMAFGVDDSEGVHQKTLHEVGHALGTGHADGDGVLMSETLDSGVDAITACDLEAVLAAQEWYFDGLGEPRAPTVDSVDC